AVHDIDLIRWFTESEIAEVQPQLSNAVAEREDIALLQFRTASGVLAHINTNWLTPFKARNVTIATRNKYITGDLLTRQVTECFGFQPDGSYSMRHLSVGHAEPLRAELQAFVGAIRNGKEPAVTGEGGLATPEIARPSPSAPGGCPLAPPRPKTPSRISAPAPIPRRSRSSTLPRNGAGSDAPLTTRSPACSATASSFSARRCARSKPSSPRSAARVT